MKSFQRQDALNYAILSAFALLSLFPLLRIVILALTPTTEASAAVRLPSELAFGNFATAWQQGRFSDYMLSSVIVAVAVVLLTSAFSVLSGYAFAVMPFRGSGVIFYTLMLGMMIPRETTIAALYHDMRAMDLLDSYWSLVLPQVATFVAFGTFWMRMFFRSLPSELAEAARVDGASAWRILWSIYFPLSRPALVTMAVLVFMWTWNEFFLPLVMISTESLRTAPLGLAFFSGQHVTEHALMAAAATIVALPVVILYLFLQRQVIAGMLSGAIKG